MGVHLWMPIGHERGDELMQMPRFPIDEGK